MRTGFVFLIIIWMFRLTGWGQPDNPPLQIGLGLVGFSYHGDLTTQERNFLRAHPGGNLSIQFDGARPLQFQINAGYGRFVEQIDGEPVPFNAQITPNNFVETSFFYSDLRFRYQSHCGGYR